MQRKILITGAAGFIGFHSCVRLLRENHKVIGLDNINNYYDKNLKYSRLDEIKKLAENNKYPWHFFEASLEDSKILGEIYNKYKPEIVIHLAAQAGVRYSIQNPKPYIDSNILGFFNILEFCRKNKILNFIYASSSSVYGGNTKLPFNENDPVNHPVSLYAATEKANEVMAHSYSHLYSIPSIGLRFFTVYGPWGRPDMAPMIFTKAILKNKPIKIFNKGEMYRDFTYIDDVTEIICRLVKKPAFSDKLFNKKNPTAATSWAPHRIFNVGNSKIVNLMDFISILEDELNIKAIKEYKGMQSGDVISTFSDTEKISDWVDFKPDTSLKDGIKEFVKWYRNYY